MKKKNRKVSTKFCRIIKMPKKKIHFPKFPKKKKSDRSDHSSNSCGSETPLKKKVEKGSFTCGSPVRGPLNTF